MILKKSNVVALAVRFKKFSRLTTDVIMNLSETDLSNMGMLMAQIEDIEGIGSKYAEKLKAEGIASVEKLLESGATAKGRDALATKTGISSQLLLTWVNHADLFRIKGIAGQFSELLEAAGVDTVPELAQRNAENLQLTLAKTNEEKKLAKTTPSLTQVTNWIDEAKSLPKVVQH
jgi:hypothetical protein